MEKCIACKRGVRPLFVWYGVLKLCGQCRNRLIGLGKTTPAQFSAPLMPANPQPKVKPQLSLF